MLSWSLNQCHPLFLSQYPRIFPRHHNIILAMYKRESSFLNSVCTHVHTRKLAGELTGSLWSIINISRKKRTVSKIIRYILAWLKKIRLHTSKCMLLLLTYPFKRRHTYSNEVAIAPNIFYSSFLKIAFILCATFFECHMIMYLLSVNLI